MSPARLDTTFAYRDPEAGDDVSIPCRLQVARRDPERPGDEEEWRLAELVEDLADHLTAETDRKVAGLVDDAAAALASELGGLAAAGDGQIRRLVEVFRNVGLPCDGEPEVLSEPQRRFAWAAVAETSVLALLDTLAAEPEAVDGLDSGRWAKSCARAVDTARFRRASGLAESDLERALSVTAGSAVKGLSRSDETPLVYRNRWLRVREGGGELRVRHFVPGVLIVGPDPQPAAGGGGPDVTQLLPLAPAVEFGREPAGVVVRAATADGRLLTGSVHLATEDDAWRERQHSLCVLGGLAATGDRGPIGHPTPFGDLWEWDATEQVALGTGSNAAGQADGVDHAIDSQRTVRFVQPDPVERH